MATARSIFTTDHGHTVIIATRGLNASLKLVEALRLTARERTFWDQVTAYWRAQLGFAEKRGRR